MNNTRRKFLQQAMIAGTAAGLPLPLFAKHENSLSLLPAGATILFQGDSITDGGRRKGNDWNHILGQGYAFMIAGKVGFEHPNKNYLIVNRGISGNKIPDLEARWEADTIAVKPDVLSILVGINDISVAVTGNLSFTTAAYEEGYRRLLQHTKEKFPAIHLVIGQPFALPGTRTNDQWEKYISILPSYQQTAKKLANEFDTAFVAYGDLFVEAAKTTSNSTWLWDGVHPMPAGHELMANAWIKAVNEKFNLF
jgi:lysophospholipase L1-like esterase